MKYSEHKIFKNKLPVQALFEPFIHDRLPFLLESGQNTRAMGRYSYFGSDPFLTLSCKGNKCVVGSESGKKEHKEPALIVLRRLLDSYKLEGSIGLKSPFLCGAVGFFAYDFGFSIENIKRSNKPDSIVPDLMFGFYDVVIRFDHIKKELMVFSSGFPLKGPARRTRSAQRLKVAIKKLSSARVMLSKAGNEAGGLKIKSNFSRQGYIRSVKRAKDYIACGDIYQVNLSQKFSFDAQVDDWRLYRNLAVTFPVDFAAYFNAGDFVIISASPEKFLCFNGKRVSTRPMKGTRRRTEDPYFNKLMRNELLDSGKEKAELLMITDLERNDLGRVCEYGSVRVASHRQIEAYRNVFQATAEINGILSRDKDRIDLINACFPGGSVTGAPKIRAMEIIEELEPDSRSIYTGSLGYLSFHNTLEFNILIRSFLKTGRRVSFHAGGGIVTDSSPESEYDETLVKAAALMEALNYGC